MIKTRVRVTKGKTIPKRLNEARGRLKNRAEAHEEMKDYAIQKWDAHINSNGSGTWAGLASFSWRRGTPTPAGSEPLKHKGALFANIRAQGEAGKVDGGYVRWRFSNRPPSYPLSHQFGINPYFQQPPRVIWQDWDGRDEDATREILERWVRTQLGGLL